MGTPKKIRWLIIQCEFQDPKMEVLYHIRPGKKPAVKKDMSRSEQNLVGGLEHELYDFPFSWEFQNPN